jgi:ABC-2 type transport system ATP-binding protein
VEAAVAALATVPGLSDVNADGQDVWARTRDGGAAIPDALAALGRIDAPIAGVTTERPSLDDVYLHYAGRRLSTTAVSGDSETADAGTGDHA